MKTCNAQEVPAKWPFPPATPPGRVRGQPSKGSAGRLLSSASTGSRGRSARRPAGPALTRGAMLIDVCLVAAWGAMIPGLMWLGVAGGF